MIVPTIVENKRFYLKCYIITDEYIVWVYYSYIGIYGIC